MIRKLMQPVKAFCTPTSASQGAIVSLAGKAHRIVSLTDRGGVVTQVIGRNEGWLGKLNKERTEITFDKEHDWEPKAAV